MKKLIAPLKCAARRFPPVAAIAREINFQIELAAHRKLIRPYALRNEQNERRQIVKTPLLIGYFETNFGLGESARSLASALEAVETPFSIYPYNGFTGRSRDEAPWARLYDVDKVHSVNIFCMAADQTSNARRIIGKRRVNKSYNILSTFWELPHAPDAWRSELENFDELWVPNKFVAHSFRSIFAKQIFIMPPCIDLDTKIAPDRAKFGLDATKYYFLFSFDFNSYPERKNPIAVVNAFKIAFGDKRDDVGLILKSNGASDRFPEIMSKLTDASNADRRVIIWHGNWPRTDVLVLLASVNCYVSLHRSEGFGSGMAESMFLGKSVIGTDFSGNTEYLTTETGYPVPYQMHAVGDGMYPHHVGNTWASPDINKAAEIMRSVVNDADAASIRALRGQTFVRQRYSPKAVGALITARLRQLNVA